MASGSDFSTERHEDTRYFTVVLHHALPDGTVEDVFCGQAQQDGDGTWSSHHLPLDTPPFATLDDAARALAESGSSRSNPCRGCGSLNRTGIEYAIDDPRHYDGVSEWLCTRCGRRWGRFTGEVYEEGTGR